MQYQNTLFAIYNPYLLEQLIFNTSITHAYFFAEGYEQVVESNNWVLAKHSSTYVALYSYRPIRWEEGPSSISSGYEEIIAIGNTNVWICHVGEQSEYGSFDKFVESIAESEVNVVFSETDSLILCLEKNSCLTGNILESLNCLKNEGICGLQGYRESSDLAKCLIGREDGIQKKSYPELLSSYVNCLNRSGNDAEVRWSVNGVDFTFGWNENLSVHVSFDHFHSLLNSICI